MSRFRVSRKDLSNLLFGLFYPLPLEEGLGIKGDNSKYHHFKS